MIPKIIHYCWFGGNPLPNDVIKCINSWKTYCPDYKIIRWDETNYDINNSKYVQEAYEEKKWAFVSDVARLKIVYDNGGIYLDTDVELIKSLDGVLDNSFFFAIEKDSNPETGQVVIQIATGLGFGAEKGNPTLKLVLDEYENAHFKKNSLLDMTPCPVRNTRALAKCGFKMVDKLQKLRDGTIYPSDYFCPIECSTKIKRFTTNTISIHHYSSSWKTGMQAWKFKIRTTKRVIIAKMKKLHNAIHSND